MMAITAAALVLAGISIWRMGRQKKDIYTFTEELEENLVRGEQAILFLNRRGASRMVSCGECGHVPECPRCSVKLTYHSANGRLMCHYCGYTARPDESCPTCGNKFRRFSGAGTQKVEQERGSQNQQYFQDFFHALFPHFRLTPGPCQMLSKMVCHISFLFTPEISGLY